MLTTVIGGFLEAMQKGNLTSFKVLIQIRCLLSLREITILKRKSKDIIQEHQMIL